MKKILILFVYLFSFFNLFSQVNPVGAGRIPNATTNFTTSVPYGFSLIDANTNKSYRVIRANGLDFDKKLSDYTLGTDYLGSLTSLSVICNNGITKTLTDSTSNPVLTLGLGNITPTSISTSGTINTGSIFTQKSTLALESAPLGIELTDANNWTATSGWTGDYTTGFKHTAGVTTLSRIMTNTVGNLYQISWTVTGRTVGSFTVGLGGEISNITFTATGAYAPKTLSTDGDLIFTPTTDFNGTISAISVKQITGTYNAIYNILDNTGVSMLEIRSSLNSLENQFIGKGSGRYNTTGNSNTANGYGSLYFNTTGNNNTANGYYSLYFNTTGNNNTANGVYSLLSNTTGNWNTANGYASLYSNTTGNWNTANGYASLYSNTTGYQNTAYGFQSLYSNTTGSNNTANGFQSLFSNTTGYQNTANGYASLLSNTTGYQNTANGYASLFSNTTGYYNTANGFYSLCYNTTGYYNTANGMYSLFSNTTGYQNTANGCQSLYFNTTGNNNTAYGYNSGRYAGAGTTILSAPSNSLFLGCETRASADGLTNENVIGYGAIGNGSNTITLGNENITNTYLKGAVSTNSTITGTQLISNIAQGTAPLAVTSTTKVDSLNADLLDGYEASHFGTGNGSVTSIATTSPLTGGTITTTGTIAINSDTLLSWARRKDTANIFLGKIRASHEYLGKYANAVSATNATNATLIYNQSDYDDLDVEWRIPFTTFDNNNPSYYYTDADITWNPFTKKITAGLNGTASYANKVEIDTVRTPISGDDMRVALILPTGGNQKVYMDNTLLYSSDRETLTVPNLKGNATSSNKTDSIYMNIFDSNRDYYIAITDQFDDYSSIGIGGEFRYNPSTNTLIAPHIEGDLIGDVTGNVSGSSGSCTGNSATATSLYNPYSLNVNQLTSGAASAYTVPVSDGSGHITWGAVSGGINAKTPVDVVATNNITLSGIGQTIDGITITAGMSVLAIAETAPAGNGLYTTASGDWTRRTDADTWAELYQAYVPVKLGTSNGSSAWYCTIPSSGTLGLSYITFTQFLFPASIEAGDGLTKTGTTLSVNTDNSTIEINSDILRVKDAGITNAKIATGINAAKIANGSVSNTEFQYLDGATGTTGTGNLVYSTSPTFTTNATSPKFTSTITTGTAPFTVSSTTKVTNLNTDQVDGADLETIITNSDAKIPTSKAVETYISNLNSGGLARNIRTIQTEENDELATSDYTILVDCLNNNVNITLPQASLNFGRIYNIVQISTTSSYNVIIWGHNHSEYINNSTSMTWHGATQYYGKTLQCDGTRWVTLP